MPFSNGKKRGVFSPLYGRIAPRSVRLDTSKFRSIRRSYFSESGTAGRDRFFTLASSPLNPLKSPKASLLHKKSIPPFPKNLPVIKIIYFTRQKPKPTQDIKLRQQKKLSSIIPAYSVHNILTAAVPPRQTAESTS